MSAHFHTTHEALIGEFQVLSDSYAKTVEPGGSAAFWGVKRVCDIIGSLVLLPFLGASALVLLLINPYRNPGPLLFVQIRMGRDCKPFHAIKFRTMTVETRMQRGHDDPIELHRITRLGGFLRRTRIDELPQIINVLRGEMSLLGPRPDYFTHAKAFLRAIPEYRLRHQVRPGISGLAQVDLGYAEGIEATRAKARTDLIYIRNAGFALDARIVFKTLRVILARGGA